MSVREELERNTRIVVHDAAYGMQRSAPELHPVIDEGGDKDKK